MTSKSTAVGAPLKAKELGWMTHLIPTLEAEIQKNPSAESPSCQCSTPQLPQSSDFAGLSLQTASSRRIGLLHHLERRDDFDRAEDKKCPTVLVS